MKDKNKGRLSPPFVNLTSLNVHAEFIQLNQDITSYTTAGDTTNTGIPTERESLKNFVAFLEFNPGAFSFHEGIR